MRETGGEAAISKREELLLQGLRDFVVATGIVPRAPRVEGINPPKLLSYFEALRDWDQSASGMAITGADCFESEARLWPPNWIPNGRSGKGRSYLRGCKRP